MTLHMVVKRDCYHFVHLVVVTVSCGTGNILSLKQYMECDFPSARLRHRARTNLEGRYVLRVCGSKIIWAWCCNHWEVSGITIAAIRLRNKAVSPPRVLFRCPRLLTPRDTTESSKQSLVGCEVFLKGRVSNIAFSSFIRSNSQSFVSVAASSPVYVIHGCSRLQSQSSG